MNRLFAVGLLAVSGVGVAAADTGKAEKKEIIKEYRIETEKPARDVKTLKRNLEFRLMFEPEGPKDGLGFRSAGGRFTFQTQYERTNLQAQVELSGEVLEADEQGALIDLKVIVNYMVKSQTNTVFNGPVRVVFGEAVTLVEGHADKVRLLVR